jgi:hypothetical protein
MEKTLGFEGEVLEEPTLELVTASSVSDMCNPVASCKPDEDCGPDEECGPACNPW